MPLVQTSASNLFDHTEKASPDFVEGRPHEDLLDGKEPHASTTDEFTRSATAAAAGEQEDDEDDPDPVVVVEDVAQTVVHSVPPKMK